jgi:hypothetical protein
LVVGEVNKPAVAAQALLPWQDPAPAQQVSLFASAVLTSFLKEIFRIHKFDHAYGENNFQTTKRRHHGKAGILKQTQMSANLSMLTFRIINHLISQTI